MFAIGSCHLPLPLRVLRLLQPAAGRPCLRPSPASSPAASRVAFPASSLAAFLAPLLLTAGLALQPATAAERLKIVTSFTVIADITANIAGDAADVVSITKPGAEIHGYQPTPKDLVRAADADLILWNGLGLELWFEQFLSTFQDVPAITLTEGITPIAVNSGNYKGKPNPHAWMSLDNAFIYINTIADALARHDPANAATYKNNAEAYKTRLATAMEPLRQQIRALPEEQRWLVTCEGAFSYLAEDFGLKELYLWPMNADQTGTPKQVKKVIDSVRANAIPVVFCESTVNTAAARQVARETGASFGGVLFVDSLSTADGPVPDYISLMKTTAKTILKGLTANSR